MDAGEFDRRITFERFGMTRNELNQPVEGWTEIGKRWASKQDLSDVEKVRAAQVGATITTRFRIRWSRVMENLSSADRIVYRDRVYEIVGVKEIGRRERLEITASTPGEALAGTTP